MERKTHLIHWVLGLIFAFFTSNVWSQLTHDYKQNATFEYNELIAAYKNLAITNKLWHVSFDSIGQTDSGKPLHCFTFFNKKYQSIADAKANGCVTIFINNGIHPGESCGIEASFLFAQKMLFEDPTGSAKNDKTIYCIIPIFNVGGMLNRNCCTRSNQNGPENYGFRGSSKNLDLNRDFIKCDATETQSLVAFLRKIDPDIFIDTHTSDGADYSYTMTLIETQQNKLLQPLQDFQQQTLTPSLYRGMESKGNEMAPYADFRGSSITSGLVDFLDIPRFSTGYSTLFHCFGYVTEAHMLKPFRQRVEATLDFLNVLHATTTQHSVEIIVARRQAKDICANQREFPIQWILDTTKSTTFTFKGFEETTSFHPEFDLNTVTYNTSKPITYSIPFFKKYNSAASVEKPAYYVVPQQWKSVIHLLTINNIPLLKLSNDTLLKVESYSIMPTFKNRNAYEGHYLHSGVTVEKKEEAIQCFEGDYLVKLGTANDYFLVSVLEPTAVDSYFAWNFFDEILMQKEYYSNYLILPQFADKLKNDSEFKALYNSLKAKGLTGDELVYELYRATAAYEKTHLRYPIFRIN